MTDELLEEIRDALLPEHKGEHVAIPGDTYELVDGTGNQVYVIKGGITAPAYTWTTSSAHTHSTHFPHFTTARGSITYTSHHSHS